jgi:hypothetical protein
MEFVLKYFWLVIIVIGLVNSFILYFRSKQYWLLGEKQKQEVLKLIKSVTIFSLCPWVFMGIASVAGNINSVIQFIVGVTRNYYVTSWYILIVIYFGIYLYWIFLKNGAETIVKYNKIYYGRNRLVFKSTVNGVKIATVMSIIIGSVFLGFFLVISANNLDFNAAAIKAINQKYYTGQ